MAQLRRLEYNTLDVFTTTTFAGNPLGLVHLKGVDLTQQQKQRLAIEFNYSETVILHYTSTAEAKTSPATYNAQIFTPKSELPFAGHPTIGTAVWIFENLEKDATEIVINLKAGAVHAHFDRSKAIAKASIPHEVRVHGERMTWERVVQSQPGLATASDSSGLAKALVPIVSPVRGLSFVLVDLTAQPNLLERVIPTKTDIAYQTDLDPDFNDGNLVGSVFYHHYPQKDATDNVIRIRQRVMVIELEDPATGSACATLCAYIALQKAGANETYKFEIDQGIEMGRASKIFVDVKLSRDGKNVENVDLSGQAVEVMSGQIAFS